MELFKDTKLLSKLSLLPAQTLSSDRPTDTTKARTDDKCDESSADITGSQPDESDALRNKVVALYFAASWCPASQQFTPLLRELYDELQQRKAPFEIIAIPCDKTKAAAELYFTSSHGDWLSLAFEDHLTGELKEQFNVTAIPKLVVLRPDGSVITYRGRKDVQDKGVVCFRGWINATNLTIHTQPLKTNSSATPAD